MYEMAKSQFVTSPRSVHVGLFTMKTTLTSTEKQLRFVDNIIYDRIQFNFSSFISRSAFCSRDKYSNDTCVARKSTHSIQSADEHKCPTMTTLIAYVDLFMR